MTKRLILLPGWGLDAAVLHPLAEALDGEVHALPALTSVNPQDWLDELDARLPRDCWLAGWSLGGMLASVLAARRGASCAGLISLASNACFIARPGWQTAMPQTTFEAFYQGCQQQPDATRKRFAMLCAQGAEDARGLSRQLQGHTLVTDQAHLLAGLAILSTLDNRAALASYAGPQLHLLAEGDALVPASAADELLALLSRGEVAVFDGCSHAFVLEQPQILAAAMREFMREAGDD